MEAAHQLVHNCKQQHILSRRNFSGIETCDYSSFYSQLIIRNLWPNLKSLTSFPFINSSQILQRKLQSNGLYLTIMFNFLSTVSRKPELVLLSIWVQFEIGSGRKRRGRFQTFSFERKDNPSNFTSFSWSFSYISKKNYSAAIVLSQMIIDFFLLHWT